MEATDKKHIQQRIQERWAGIDPEVGVDWEMMEISFGAGRKGEYKRWIKACMKAGMLIATEEDLPAVAIELKRAGIREVVEFIEQWALRANYQADPSKECWGISDEEIAKLKEWNIRGVE